MSPELGNTSPALAAVSTLLLPWNLPAQVLCLLNLTHGVVHHTLVHFFPPEEPSLDGKMALPKYAQKVRKLYIMLIFSIFYHRWFLKH